MLSTIDAKTISFFQWIVRQFELYTEIKREGILKLHLSILKYLLTILILLASINAVLAKAEWGGYVFFFLLTLPAIFISFIPIYFELQKLSKKKSPKQTLPKEITSRSFCRKGFFLLLSIHFPVAFFLMPSDFFSKITEPINFVLFVLWCTVCSLYILENLLCTTSPPPGEKEKRKLEKEMKSMVPIPSK